MKEIIIKINLEIIESFNDNKDKIGMIYYPNEGNKIQLVKGLNKIEFKETLLHEIGHLFDWYISDGVQSLSKNIRELNAEKVENLVKIIK